MRARRGRMRAMATATVGRGEGRGMDAMGLEEEEEEEEEPGNGSGPRTRRVTFGRERVSSRPSSAPERLRLPAIHPCPLPSPSPPGALPCHAFSSCPPQAASAGPWPAASARRRAVSSPFPRNCRASVAKRPLREWHECVLRRGDVQTLEARPQVCTRLMGCLLLWHGEGPT